MSKIPSRKIFSPVSFFALIACIALLSGFSISIARGEEALSIADLEKQQKEAVDMREKQLQEINAKIKAYDNIVKLKRKQGATIADQLSSLEAQAARLETEIRRNEQQIFDLETSTSNLSSRIDEKGRVLTTQRLVLSNLLRSYYAETGNVDLAFFSGEESSFYFNREEWTAQTGDRIRLLMNELVGIRESMMRERKELEQKKLEADSLRLQLDKRNDYLEGTKETKSTLLAQTQTEQTRYESLVDQLKREREQIENEIEDIESGKIDALDLSKIPKFLRGLFSWPVDPDDFSLSQGYGKTAFAKKAYKSGFHNGTDFAASVGTPVIAPMGGKVIGVGNNGKYAYGKWIAIDHGNGLTTLYGHLSSQDVKKGEKVKSGETIGKIGNTGYSTGPHLHFSVFSSDSFELVESTVVNGLYIPVGASINPMSYLPTL